MTPTGPDAMNRDLTPERLQASEQLLVPDQVLLRDGPQSGYAVVVRDGAFAD